MFKRKVVRTGPGSRYFALPLPPKVAEALNIANGGELDLDLVQTDDGQTVLIVSRGG